MTLGVEFTSKNIRVDKHEFKIQIWDTAGQENFRSITRAYYKNSCCAFLVYDITNRESFFNIHTWMEECKAQSPKSILMVLIGNKVDLEEKRKVSKVEGEEFAKNNGLIFFETSALNDIEIDNSFYESAKIISDNLNSGKYDLSSEVSFGLINFLALWH